MTKAEFKQKIQKLVQAFKDQDGWDKSEEHIQSSFTLKLLELLGWGSSNWTINTGQEIKTGKKPDIILKNESSKLLVIESKEASKKDKLDGKYINQTFEEQLFKYCDAEGLEWGILTNFVEWRIYSVHHKRLYKRKLAFYDILWDGANKADYLDLLSDEGLGFLELISKKYLTDKNGRIDNDPIYYAQQEDIKKEFFEKIKKWRASLRGYISKNFSRDFNNDQERIDVAAQRIIDRMIFMDICHDKKVINENHIKAVLQSKKQKYDELKEKFRKMDEKFNTELFAEDECDQIKISDEIIVTIIKELEEIDFSKLSVHIIGEVYENYLGELSKSNAKKEEVVKSKQKAKRKSQGIYYTPDYIVDYIVKNTVGDILKNCKTEKEIEKIRVLDPACGSGSFLIRAFDEFYDAYQRVHRRQEGFIFEVKKEILQKNLFGVDLDPKAVEITKLNLMIKALEGVKPKHLQGKHLLPNLNLNIRCGNSLIGGEVIADKQEKVSLFDTYESEIDTLSKLKDDFYHAFTNQDKKALLKKIEEKEEFINNNHTFGLNRKLKTYFRNLEKIKPFNYSVAFAEVMRDGGFDAVIGNPPYGAEVSTNEKKYHSDVYNIGSSDTAILFIKKAFELLGKKGKLGFIVPKAFCFASNYKKIRNYVFENLEQVIDCSKAWKEVKLEQIIFVINKARKLNNYFSGAFKKEKISSFGNIEKSDAKEFDFVLNGVTQKEIEAAKKIKENSLMLNDIATNQRGVILNKFDKDGKFSVIGCKEIDRYMIRRVRGYINKDLSGTNAEIKENAVLVQGIVAHIENPNDHIKIIANVPDNGKYFLADNINQIIANNKFSKHFVWAILNSSLINWYAYRFIYGKSIRTMRFDNPVTSRIPIPKTINEQQRGLSSLAKEIINLNKTPESREKNQNKIKALDYEIDQLVYKLYGLTKEEIKIIEGGN